WSASSCGRRPISTARARVWSGRSQPYPLGLRRSRIQLRHEPGVPDRTLPAGGVRGRRDPGRGLGVPARGPAPDHGHHAPRRSPPPCARDARRLRRPAAPGGALAWRARGTRRGADRSRGRFALAATGPAPVLPDLRERARGRARPGAPGSPSRGLGAGRGRVPPERERLEAQARRHDLDARFEGNVSRERIGQLYREAACVVLASRRGEGLPNVLLEAFAYARPAVATSISGVRDLVTDGANGLLVPPGDVGALRGALARIFNERGLAERLGAAARATVERFAWDRVRPALEDAL